MRDVVAECSVDIAKIGTVEAVDGPAVAKRTDIKDRQG
jgi:hypothetical protein